MNRYKLIIFDLDGTLADTSPGILNCVRYVQAKMNLPEITLQAMYSHVGPPMEESYNKNFGLEGDELKTAVKLHKEYAVEQGYKELELYPDIVETVNLLKNQGYMLAIATLKSEITAKKIFEELGMSEKFDIIVGTNQNDLVTKEQVLAKCIDELDVEKQKVVLIGDSTYDAIGAENVQIDFLAVMYGFGFKKEEDVVLYNNIGTLNKISDIWTIL